MHYPKQRDMAPFCPLSSNTPLCASGAGASSLSQEHSEAPGQRSPAFYSCVLQHRPTRENLEIPRRRTRRQRYQRPQTPPTARSAEGWSTKRLGVRAFEWGLDLGSFVFLGFLCGCSLVNSSKYWFHDRLFHLVKLRPTQPKARPV